MDNTVRRAKFSEVFRYGFGGIGSNIAFMLVMMYLMFFYTDFLGINAAAVGGLFLVSRFIDAVTDPVMGMIADRSNSKMGKYRPWVIVGAPILGFLVVLLFSSPNFSAGAKLVYVYVTYILYSLVSTVVNIPYHSLTPVLSEDSDQRTVIATAKQLLGQVGFAVVMVGAIPITTALGGDARAWQLYAFICAVLITLSFYICAWGAKKHDTPEVYKKNAVNGSDEKISLKEQFQLIYKNKDVLMLMIAFGTDMIAYASANAVNMYYFKYAVGRPDLIPLTSGVGLLIGIAVSFTIPFLSKKFGKKVIFMTASATLMVVSSVLFFIPFTSINLIIAQAIVYAGLGPFTGVVGWAMLADCVDYGEWITGKRGAGTVSSQLTFINKLGMAIGGMLAGVILACVGYVAGQEQTPEVLNAIAGVKAFFPALGYICSLISMSFYPITKDFYEKMIADNKARA
ncbi:MAG: glycoside-pentoside-hexuronide (GPH):cation symporter [Spirochaetales bacterium]|nr:glycoside-pentoside-hexuronide (GPH):cation symporter [Spirochaetales bacterium]